MHDDSLDALRYCTIFMGGRHCGKTALAKELARQLLNSNYGLASTDNWAQRYLYTVDKVYDTLGIKDYLNKIYGDPMTAKRSVSLKELSKRYGCDIDLTANSDLINQIIKEEEKNKMADQKQIYTFTIKSSKGNYYEITIEKDFRNIYNYPYRVRVCAARTTEKDADCKIFESAFGYRYWEQLETQFIYDLVSANGIFINKDWRDNITIELDRAKAAFGGCSFANFDSPYQGGYTTDKNKNDVRYTAPHYAMPKIEKVIFNPPATIVQWKDGTKTVVKCQEGDEFDWEKGLAMAYVKRAFNNERTYYGLFKKNEPENYTQETLMDRVNKLTKVIKDFGANASIDQNTIEEVKRYSNVPDTSSIDAEGPLMPL